MGMQSDVCWIVEQNWGGWKEYGSYFSYLFRVGSHWTRGMRLWAIWAARWTHWWIRVVVHGIWGPVLLVLDIYVRMRRSWTVFFFLLNEFGPEPCTIGQGSRTLKSPMTTMQLQLESHWRHMSIIYHILTNTTKSHTTLPRPILLILHQTLIFIHPDTKDIQNTRTKVYLS